jgi:hypothetical protein
MNLINMITLRMIYHYWEIFNHNDESFWTKFLPAILASSIGSLIGFGGTLWIYLHKKGLDEKNQLRYFAVLIKNIIQSTEAQINIYKELSLKIRGKSLEPVIREIKSNRDIDRIQDKLDQEKLFTSYINNKKESGSSIIFITERFAKIYESLDFIYKASPELTIKLEKGDKHMLELLINYNELYNKIRFAIIDFRNHLAKEIDYKNNPLFISLNLIIEKNDNTNDLDLITSYNENFINPIHDAIVKSNFYSLQEGKDIAINCAKAHTIFIQLTKGKIYMADTLDKYVIKFQERNNQLKVASSSLLESFDIKIESNVNNKEA